MIPAARKYTLFSLYAVNNVIDPVRLTAWILDSVFSSGLSFAIFALISCVFMVLYFWLDND
jgi:hypothetical protein